MTTCATDDRGARDPYASTWIDSKSSGVGSAPRTARKDSSIAAMTFLMRARTSSGSGREAPSSSSPPSNLASDSSSSISGTASSPVGDGVAPPPLSSDPFLPFFLPRFSLASARLPRWASSSAFSRWWPIRAALRPNRRTPPPSEPPQIARTEGSAKEAAAGEAEPPPRRRRGCDGRARRALRSRTRVATEVMTGTELALILAQKGGKREGRSRLEAILRTAAARSRYCRSRLESIAKCCSGLCEQT
mmetsp:Transcript_60631/g.179777  ORF Transcript_60631/g.179777 Transcript_60631/m.179777 type:complete len:247 (-) Transcript_60631:117-857(-)